MCKKDHIFIRFIEFGLLNSDRGFSDTDINSWYKQSKVTDIEQKLCNVNLGKFFKLDLVHGEPKYFINADAYFNYIEYIELREARKNSVVAFWSSIFAIMISLGSIFYAVFGDVKLEKDTTINLSKSSIESIVNGINK